MGYGMLGFEVVSVALLSSVSAEGIKWHVFGPITEV